jgi:hypothetical protein
MGASLATEALRRLTGSWRRSAPSEFEQVEAEKLDLVMVVAQVRSVEVARVGEDVGLHTPRLAALPEQKMTDHARRGMSGT